jgi:tRNA(Arg) A34 adenosine deaminase TadA
LSKHHIITAQAFDKRGRLLSSAVNNYRKSHPIQAHFAELAGEKERIYLHAEIAALLRAGDAAVHSLRISRFNKKGDPVCAKPCKVCSLAIKHWKVSNVIHS